MKIKEFTYNKQEHFAAIKLLSELQNILPAVTTTKEQVLRIINEMERITSSADY